ncbi:MAG: hypothetical protein BWK75_04980 [Candidatus Altiarchaeales archaeon A3]|nr:MAG: hypothetical protein BWK75_04980 [Candidatus Altiarchaeales archaeon A3]
MKKKVVIIGVIAVIASLLIYAFEIEPNWIETTHTKIKISDTTDENFSCNLLVISDFHVASEEHEKFLEKVVNEINKISKTERIDAVIIDGDIIDYKTEEIKFLAPLKNIEHKNVYAVLGNHDYSYGWSHKEIADEVEKYMKDSGVDVMRNENRVICGGKIRMVGIDELWSGQYNLSKSYDVKEEKQNKQKILPNVLISHNPDIIYVLKDEHPDLIISGHTHGGQVKIPFLGPVTMPSNVGKICPEGLCNVSGYEIYITRGIGGNPRVRFLSRPEISVIELNFI